MQHAPHQGPKPCKSASGFSLVELLMAIMIIGIMLSLAMMVFGGGLSDEAKKQRDKRNAQMIANTAAMAAAAGAQYFEEDDEDATVTNLRDGCAPTTGIFRGRVFKLPSMSDDDIQGAQVFLKLNDTDLIYDSSGTP